MIVKMDTDFVYGKMEELGAGLLEQEAYKELRASIDRFAADSEATAQYERFMELHRVLEEKERQEQETSETEMEIYDRQEQALYENEVIRKFLYAQREFSQLHNLVSQFFMKTVEFNRLPAKKEVAKGGCGCGGNCGGH